MTALIVSDVHLDRDEPAITAHFLDFLAGEARGASALYILGDLFESWLGDDDAGGEHAAVEAALAALSASGVALYLMHGNRDFLLGEAFCARTGARLLEDPTILEQYGRRLLLSHGDALCTDDVPYQKLRALVRDQALKRRFLSLSRRTRAALVGEAREGSREHTRTQAMALMDVNDAAVRTAFRRAKVNLIVHGHTHRPGVHELEIDGEPCTRIVLGDWYREGSVLRLEPAGPSLARLARAASGA